MRLSDYLKRFDYIHWLIKQQATGDCNEFAKKLGICKRQLHNTLADLRGMGAPIAYSKTKNSYYYTHAWQPFKGMPPKDLNAIKGGRGYFKNSLPSEIILHPALLNLSNFCLGSR